MCQSTLHMRKGMAIRTTNSRFGYSYKIMTRSGFNHCHIFFARFDAGRPSSSLARFSWMVSGCRKKQRMVAVPARAV
jgi:hypothetical protein